MSSFNVLQPRTNSTQRTGPNKLGALERKENPNQPRPKPEQRNQQQRVFGKSLTNKQPRSVCKDDEIEFAHFNDFVMPQESPLDRLDLKGLRQPAEYRKKPFTALTEFEDIAINTTLGIRKPHSSDCLELNFEASCPTNDGTLNFDFEMPDIVF